VTADRTVVLDCRWLGIGGPGRTTEFALRGLALDPPPGRWVLWGPEEATTGLAWPGADVRPIAEDPRVLLGQRRAFEIPGGDFYVFMHQQRPLRPLPAVTVVYDTIALRFGTTPAVRRVKRLFMRRVARTSRRILTISEHSRATILRDLGVAPDRVEILRFPFDEAFVGRVAARRATTTPAADVALFIGGFLPHKNLPRLLAAFAATDFSRDGGRLVLVGGTSGQAAELVAGLDDRQRGFVDVRHSCRQAEIDELFATSLFLVQPSLEEGFGLPAWEAMCCGLPVCVSNGGSLPEITKGFAEPFPAESVPAIAAAIDATAAAARRLDDATRSAQVARLRASAPTVADFGNQFRTAVLERSTAAP
jgi:glycosyltransferase involved in cell wall biosynthesis